MKSKKAISPLIATVLIIGFTIVLAAVVIQWGSQLVDQLKGQTQTTTELSLACSSGLTNLKITKAEITTGPPKELKVTLDNPNEQVVSGLIFRKYFKDANGIETVTSNTNETDMNAYDKITYTIDTTGESLDDIVKLGVIPKVKLTDGSEKGCSLEKIYNFV